ncbi:hypothetical protein ABEB36_007664 [Hypothenemus hampei]|uniref:mRNA decay factor PAT1 domain-containing protein n=1 Tax=Hypothenemus hampei TaxID=57062 RepID=A0ABD1EUR3_HYPHA
MANSFFDFNASMKEGSDLKNGEHLLPEEDDDGYENEEEYDALNDETFGACETLDDDDWEQRHEEFAEINESSKHNEKLEQTVSQLKLGNSSDEDDDDDDDAIIEPLTFPRNSSVWTYTPQTNGDSFNNSSVLSSLQKASKSFIATHTQNTVLPFLNNDASNRSPSINFPNKPGKICTVEELEKNLLKSSQQNAQQRTPAASSRGKLTDAPPVHPILPNHVNLQAQGQQRPLLQLPPHAVHPYTLMQHPPRLPPPGLPPMNIPPNLRHLPPPPMMNGPHHPMMPPGFRMMCPLPHMMPPNAPRPPGFPYPLPINHPFHFPPPPHNMAPPMVVQQQKTTPQRPMQEQQYSPQKQQRPRRDSGGNYRLNNREQAAGDIKDEYAGLMTTKDKQWLLNIQMLQLNTGTPYFDDYYYTIYKERKSKTDKENSSNNNTINEKTGRFQNRQRRNSERQDGTNLTPRVYTPLQFENSLGKLQCGSVTAPRKIIDMDIMQTEKDQELPTPSKDSKKTKQYLLELEALYSLLLKAEDIENPMYVTNMEKLREMKQKQRLRELEQASTSEQKQEVLRLFKLESEPVVENQLDYINKICCGFVQDDKFSNFLNIRKGKMLLLRLLPHLPVEFYGSQLLEIWSKVLLSLPVIGRRDTAGDNLLPKMYPYFKRFVQTCTMTQIYEIVQALTEVIKQENSRSTPLGHSGKAPLYFIVLNKLGVSALVCLVLRAENIYSCKDPTEDELTRWVDFLAMWAKYSESVSKVAVPLESIPSEVFVKHVARFEEQLSTDKKATLERFYVDVNIISN